MKAIQWRLDLLESFSDDENTQVICSIFHANVIADYPIILGVFFSKDID